MTTNEQPREFLDADLRGARFERCDLSGAVMRSVDLQAADIDAPWLMEEGGSLLVNGIDVAPLVQAELDRRFPGRSERRAADPAGLRSAYAAVEDAWAAALDRVAGMPPGTVDVRVDDEWSFAQTLRHLVLATDIWLRGAVHGIEDPMHPIGQPHAEYASDGYDVSIFSATHPSYAEVLAVRAERQAMVRDYLASATPEGLATECPHPWAPERRVAAIHCLHTIIGEEWEHLRFALRDLDAIETLEA
ncbi:DinB family protein [Nocardioides sp.]|uniref:DinB family protein n=1 Tax=Nocardioides sp. TaxID=35761 RepID=UPI001DE89470|nr:DinB family protein [Nocardioides sp.]MBU1801407.1 DinB family protein [Actinomycetota bacterium]